MKPAFLLVTALVIGATQTSTQTYAGTWTAEHAGQTFVLELEGAGTAIGGRISLETSRSTGWRAENSEGPEERRDSIFDVVERAQADVRSKGRPTPTVSS